MPIYEHIFLEGNASSERFKPSPGRGNTQIPERNRIAHGEKLLSQLKEAWLENERLKLSRTAQSLPTRDGTYLSFTSQAGFDLVTRSLEDLRNGIRLLCVKERSDDKQITAVVYVPHGKEGHFVKKIEDYQNELKNTATGNPRNAPLVDSIEDIGLALLESLWTDDLRLMPEGRPKWCEAWLSVNTVATEVEKQILKFSEVAESTGVELKTNSIIFPERAVLLINASRPQLLELMLQTDSLAEFRSGQEMAGFWTSQSIIDQQDWIDNLLGRISILEESPIKICILDTGVNNGHRLLKGLLPDRDMLTANPAWGTDDHEDSPGHGTLMAGIAAYGDIEKLLSSTENVEISHRLCSVKVLPRRQQTPNPKELWGHITAQGIYRAEAQNPTATYVYCMAVSAKGDSDRGRPSSWSGAIDNLCFGSGNDKRVILLSAGNLRTEDLWNQYPNSNFIGSVESPAQAWNAVTVGAYSEKVQVADPIYNSYQPVANRNCLSPYSTTSILWERKWTVKPEVVFEGGNLLRAPDGTIHLHDDLDLLSTSKDITTRPFNTFRATSAATAKASWFCATVLHSYPGLWPETLRGLMIHSASWEPEMLQQAGAIRGNRESYGRLLKTFGYGIPNIDKALYSSESAFTLISQEEIQPFAIENGRAITNDWHVYYLPWPESLLLDLGNVPVKLKITLSYFIEPGPGEIGWKDKYRYQSYGLRFDVNNVGEDHDTFRRRINLAARESEGPVSGSSGSDRWVIGGSNINRTTGSVHSDYWEGTAAELATCNSVAVYPVIGWWRERKHLGKVESRARYSLIVSLETPLENVELYTAVKQVVDTPVEIPTGGN